MTDRAKAFGAAVRARREHIGLSRYYTAALVGVHGETLAEIERGETAPRLNTAHRIADALGRPLPFLLIDAEAALRDQRAERGAA